MNVSTCHRQEISVGVQVAYAKPINASVNNLRMYNNIHVSGGTLCVSTVQHIEQQISAAFAEADASFMLTLANGDKVNLDDVCVTDGRFEYGGKVA